MLAGAGTGRLGPNIQPKGWGSGASITLEERRCLKERTALLRSSTYDKDPATIDLGTQNCAGHSLEASFVRPNSREQRCGFCVQAVGFHRTQRRGCPQRIPLNWLRPEGRSHVTKLQDVDVPTGKVLLTVWAPSTPAPQTAPT